MKVSLSSVEDAILTRLQEDASIATYVAWLGTFQKSLEDARKAARQMKTPAIGVCYIGGDDEPGGMFRFRHTARFQVTVASRNLRNPRASAIGRPAAEVGIYQMIEDVRDALAGWSPADGVRELYPIRVEPLEMGEDGDLAIQYALVFETKGTFGRDDSEAAPFTLSAAYTIDGGQSTHTTDEHTLGTEDP